MELCDVHQMKALLEENGFHFSKAKGQNFLTAAWVPQRIAEEAAKQSGRGIVPEVLPVTDFQEPGMKNTALRAM